MRSRNVLAYLNSFHTLPVPVAAQGTDSLRLEGNIFWSTFDTLYATGGTGNTLVNNDFYGYGTTEGLPLGGLAPTSTGGQSFTSREAWVLDRFTPEPMPNGQDVALSDIPFQGRAYLLIDEWGPYDFRSPVAWPRSPRTADVQTLQLLGPPGAWRLVSSTGVDSLSATTGTLPDTIQVWRTPGDLVDLNLDFEYTGAPVTDRFGSRTAADEPFHFRYHYTFVPVHWDIQFWAYDDSTDPRAQPDAFRALLDTPPLHREQTTDLGYQWYRSPADGVPPDHFATVAEGTLTVPPGRYRLDLTSDDGVRVWLDGTLIHNDWTYHPPRLAELDLELGGSHTLRIEHFEIEGYATLVATLRKANDGL